MDNQGYQSDIQPIYNPVPPHILPPPYTPQAPVVNNVTVINAATPVYAPPIVCTTPIIPRPSILNIPWFNFLHNRLWRKYEIINDEESGKEIRRERPISNENFKIGVSLSILITVVSIIVIGLVVLIVVVVLDSVNKTVDNEINSVSDVNDYR